MRVMTASVVALMGLTALPIHAQDRAAVVQLVNRDKEIVATARLTEVGDQGVLIELEIDGLPPGIHGFHIHETGLCAPDFDAAGSHFDPHGRAHGLFHPDGRHAGDLLNVEVPSSGRVTVERLAPDVTLEPGAAASLFDDDGSALVIHEGPDDYTTQPSGDSGDPIACGVVRR
jgi:superoxide dismutase, Cu-Zn family